MDSKERAVAAVLKLAELRSELGNIAAPTGLRSNLTSAWERLKRWKSRVVEYLRENVSDQEAKRLGSVRAARAIDGDGLGHRPRNCQQESARHRSGQARAE